jgi:hypothetical protein
MGEAARKRRLLNARRPEVVYHHTNTLMTNLIWMSGVIAIEGEPHNVLHPQLGEINIGSVQRRRALKDFPGLAWFTSRIEVPRCLLINKFLLQNKQTGAIIGDAEVSEDITCAFHLHRRAIGFPTAMLMPWREHYGYHTGEGHELNETAREVGDDPDDWYVSDTPVDMLKSCEMWDSRTIMTPKLVRMPSENLQELHELIATCRRGAASGQRVYVLPSWMTVEQAKAFAATIDVPILDYGKREIE